MAKVKLVSSYWSKDSINNDFHSHTSYSKTLLYIAVSWLKKKSVAARFGNFWGAMDHFCGMAILVFDRIHLIAWSLCFLPQWHLQEFRPSYYNSISASLSLSNFSTFWTSCFYSLERRFYVFEYRKRHFPVVYCLKKEKLEKWPFLDQNHGLTSLEKCQFFDFWNFLFL